MALNAEAERAISRVHDAVQALRPGRYLLAVSGGRDSMVLLDAFSRARTDAAVVATLDHGTGRAATRASALVEQEAERRGLAVVAGQLRGARASTEAAWRAARWEFLRGSARELQATVVTAHTRDDQLETVVMRALRDWRHTSARGLAAMYAASDIARPLLDVARADVAAYARSRGVSFIEDPSNVNHAHLRNRIRLDLLPALERANPGFGAEMLALSRAAACWRASVAAFVDQLGVTALGHAVRRTLVVPANLLTDLSHDSLAVLWPALAARAGVALDWRGTERLAAFTSRAKPGGRVPLSGGAVVERTPTSFVLRTFGSPEALYSME